MQNAELLDKTVWVLRSDEQAAGARYRVGPRSSNDVLNTFVMTLTKRLLLIDNIYRFIRQAEVSGFNGGNLPSKSRLYPTGLASELAALGNGISAPSGAITHSGCVCSSWHDFTTSQPTLTFGTSHSNPISAIRAASKRASILLFR